jgi:hypothetical protein
LSTLKLITAEYDRMATHGGCAVHRTAWRFSAGLPDTTSRTGGRHDGGDDLAHVLASYS